MHSTCKQRADALVSHTPWVRLPQTCNILQVSRSTGPNHSACWQQATLLSVLTMHDRCSAARQDSFCDLANDKCSGHQKKWPSLPPYRGRTHANAFWKPPADIYQGRFTAHVQQTSQTACAQLLPIPAAFAPWCAGCPYQLPQVNETGGPPSWQPPVAVSALQSRLRGLVVAQGRGVCLVLD